MAKYIKVSVWYNLEAGPAGTITPAPLAIINLNVPPGLDLIPEFDLCDLCSEPRVYLAEFVKCIVGVDVDIAKDVQSQFIG